ncbi:MAG TPA: ClpX C4-type zinc finger protein [Candidatus Eisenbacteria bacterium]|nr:ClpX C4-type zinc finger protein [Candidatus Eisenbacteria bacterium]
MQRTNALARLDTAEHTHLNCSFCGRSAGQTRFLSAGVFGGTICDRCGFVAFAVFLKAHLRAALRLDRRSPA